jgi:hypothetical protein
MAFLRRSRSTLASRDVADGLVVRQFPAPIRRSRLGSWWDGWRAVRTGLHQRELLTYRVAQYLALAPQNRQPLPSLVTIDDDGRIVVEDNPEAERHPLAVLLDDPAGVREAGAPGPLEAQVRWLRATREARALEACSGTERADAFDAWAIEALSEPGSTFSVWMVGPDRRSYALHFLARVPASWGPGVLDAKAAFTSVGRERAASPGRLSPRDARLPAGASLSGSDPVLSEAVRVLGFDAANVASWSAAPGREALHTVVVCDRSSSTLGLACDAPRVIAAFDAWAAEGSAAPGGTFSVYVVGGSRDTVEPAYSLSVPALRAGERVAVLLGARAELMAWPSETLVGPASAIAEAISVAASDLSERQGRRSMVVLSDMREQTPRGPWNFERSAPRPRAFATWLQTEGLVADLHGVPVRVCGLHHRRGPGAGPFDARQATRIEEAWQEAFAAMGVTDLTMASTCPDPGQSERSRTAVALEAQPAAGGDRP